MSFKPFGWNVVVLGRWNPAILTPAGISKHVFCIPQTEQKNLHVEVPLDGVSPYRVKNPEGSTVVMANDHRILVEPSRFDAENLGKALEAGRNALASLPETPVIAAGVNINFKLDDLCTDLAPVLESSVDAAISDALFNIEKRTLVRSLEYGDGVINATFTQSDNETQLALNFHRASPKHEELSGWLSASATDFLDQARKIAHAFGVNMEEPSDVPND